MKSVLMFLTEDDGRCRQIVNGVVTSLNKKTPIPAPVGTSDIVIIWERSLTRWAQVRNFSLPLVFVLDGAIILRNDYYKFNIDRHLNLLIKRAVCEVDPTYYRSYYKHLYKGELDFATFEDQPGNSVVTIGIMEGGLSKLVKANENTVFDIPFDDDAIDVLMSGIRLDGIYNWILPEDQSLGIFYLGMYQLPSEKSAPGIAVFDVPQQTTTFAAGDNATSLSYFATSTEDITGVTIEGIMKYIQEGPDGGPLPSPEVTFTLELQIYNVDSDTARLEVDLAPDDPYLSTQDIAFSTTVDLLKGDRLYIKKIGRFRESTLSMTVSSTKTATTIKAFKPVDLFRKICAKIGIEAADVVSTLLESSTYCVTSGDAVRGIEGSSVKTSFNAFCKAFDVYHCAGVQIKDTVEMERRYNYFVPDSEDPAIELGNVKDFKVTPAVDLMYSSIKVGHAEQNIDDLNGKYDFNGWHIYTTPIKRVSKELDLTSPYKAGPYEIEIARINYEGKITTDSSRDNDVYILDVKLDTAQFFSEEVFFVATGNYINILGTGKYFVAGQILTITGTGLNNGTFTVVNAVAFIGGYIAVIVTEPVFDETVVANISITTGFVYPLDRSVIPDSGVPDPDTIFNVRLRPSALFEQHYRWIRSWLYGYDADSIIFQSANRNKDLVVDGLTDGRDVAIAAMGDRVFIPDYIEFGCNVPISIQETQDNTPNKPLAATWEDTRYTGFLWKAGLAPNSRVEQVFKMLSSIENDRLNLL